MTATAPSNSQPSFDLDALRLPPNYGATLGVKKVLTTVPIGKPKSSQFFRVHADPKWSISVYLVEMKETGEVHVVSPSLAPMFGGLAKPVMLFAAIDRSDNPFLIPVHLPDESGRRNPWHESRAQAVEHSKTRWVRIAANMAAGAYDVLVAQGALAEPAWPDCTPAKLFEIALRGRIVDCETHAVVQHLQGTV